MGSSDAAGLLCLARGREWLCASTGRGLVGVWNLDGVVGGGSVRRGDDGGASGAG